MKALRKLEHGPGLETVDIPTPEVGPRDCLVRVEAASICGTDLHIWNWDAWSRQRVRPPVTLGHEFAGTIVEVGGLTSDCLPFQVSKRRLKKHTLSASTLQQLAASLRPK